MAARRTLFRESDMRRLARVAKDECVAVQGHIDPMGGFTFTISPVVKSLESRGGDDLDARLAEFGRK